MRQLVVKGPCRLQGSVAVSGAKNEALKLMAACVLGQGTFVLNNVPDILDTAIMSQILVEMGIPVKRNANQLQVSVGDFEARPPERLVRKLRASIQLLGPLLAKCGSVRLAPPGGCDIGRRPIELHVDNLRRLGADIQVTPEEIIAKADGLTGQELCLSYPSVGATENLMMAAALASGVTTISNPAREPEITALEIFLNSMGAKVSGAGTKMIRIEGVRELATASQTVLPDRIETGTFVLAAAVSGGSIHITNTIPQYVQTLLTHLRASGLVICCDDNSITVKPGRCLRPLQLITGPYPGFPTDLQPQLLVWLTQVPGRSSVKDTVFSHRFDHIKELNRMGASIYRFDNTAVTLGPARLEGQSVAAQDLRGGAALVLAGLAADGTTRIRGYEHLARGYERLPEKLAQLGVCLEALD